MINLRKEEEDHRPGRGGGQHQGTGGRLNNPEVGRGGEDWERERERRGRSRSSSGSRGMF